MDTIKTLEAHPRVKLIRDKYRNICKMTGIAFIIPLLIILINLIVISISHPERMNDAWSLLAVFAVFAVAFIPYSGLLSNAFYRAEVQEFL